MWGKAQEESANMWGIARFGMIVGIAARALDTTLLTIKHNIPQWNDVGKESERDSLLLLD